jgi:hypothetical protein
MIMDNKQVFSPQSNIDSLIAFNGAEHYLSENKLYKVYLLSPQLVNHVFINKNDSIHLLSSFSEYATEVLSRQAVLFDEDEPQKLHHLSSLDMSLLVLLVPPHLIMSIDGQLFLQFEKMIPECVLGAYLMSDEEQFFISTNFNMEKLRQWIKEDSDFDSANDTDFGFNCNYA